MLRKATMSIFCVFVVAALLVISCGPQAAPAPAPAPAPTPAPAPGAVTPTPTPAAPAPAPAPASVEKPKYGGTINVILPNFTDKFDIAVSPG